MNKGIYFMILFLPLVLFCSKENGRNEPLKDYSALSITAAPEWARGGVIYQVFPRVFTEAGTFNAFRKKLDYIDSLNVDIIWFLPVYPIGEKGRKGTLGSPFSVRDFRKINPDYGSGEDFRALVEDIHRRGMKIIIGMVPNHASNDNVLMDGHPDWFMRDTSGSFTREVADWSDITDFNYDNPGLRRYMTETLVYWVKNFDIDGYRCDVAGMVPYDFWKVALDSLRRVKPDIYLLAEWEDPEILLAGFNSDYGWTEYHTMKDIRGGEERTAEILKVISEKQERYPRNSLPMRFLENHDEQRSLKVFGPQAIGAYAALLFTSPGIPLLYAGQEIGATQKPSLFEKSVLNWQTPDRALLEMYRELIRLRKSYSCFTAGNYTQLQTASISGSVGAFLREDSGSAALVVCNLRNKAAEKVLISLSQPVRTRLEKYRLQNYRNSAERLDLKNIYFENLPGFETRIFVAKK